MNERDFCYWLQGLFEVAKPDALSKEQTAMVREHLALVFTKVTGTEAPKPTGPDPALIEERAKAMKDFFRAVERARTAPYPPGRMCLSGISFC